MRRSRQMSDHGYASVLVAHPTIANRHVGHYRALNCAGKRYYRPYQTYPQLLHKAKKTVDMTIMALYYRGST